MKSNNQKVEWVRSSSTPTRTERLQAHQEFESSDLKRLLDEGWQITSARIKRARIQKTKQPKEVIVSVFGGKLKMTFTEYQEKGQGLKVLMEIF